MIEKMPTVLLVDDDDVIGMCIRRGFKREKLAVHLHTCADGLDALQYLLRCSPESLPVVTLLDLTMPQMDGLTFLRYVRSVKSLEQLEVYVLSGSQNPIDQQVAQALGIAGYLAKPQDASSYAEIIAGLSHVWERIGIRKPQQTGT